MWIERTREGPKSMASAGAKGKYSDFVSVSAATRVLARIYFKAPINC